jgi:hypothetical protein
MHATSALTCPRDSPPRRPSYLPGCCWLFFATRVLPYPLSLGVGRKTAETREGALLYGPQRSTSARCKNEEFCCRVSFGSLSAAYYVVLCRDNYCVCCMLYRITMYPHPFPAATAQRATRVIHRIP